METQAKQFVDYALSFSPPLNIKKIESLMKSEMKRFKKPEMKTEFKEAVQKYLAEAVRDYYK